VLSIAGAQLRSGGPGRVGLAGLGRLGGLSELDGLRHLAVWLCAGLALATGCRSAQEKRIQTIYGPTESILEVVAVLRRHVDDDTYRFRPATDFTGRNVYRSTLLRLENLERVHSDALRSGHMDAVIHFAKARSLERLRAFDLAAEHYESAATRGGAHHNEAMHSRRTRQELHATRQLGFELRDPLARSEDESEAGYTLPLDPEKAIASLDERSSHLSALYDEESERHYAYVIREELEHTDVVRARYFVAMRHSLTNGQIRAVGELQRLIVQHSASKNSNRHMLDLADLYAALAEEYTQVNAPESLNFDPAKFQELVDAASQIYQSVASEDGTPEKLEAARRFEAFLAFTLKVDRDRFTR
jgi:hypothetical protein